ncbi:hypothetical protein P7C71_g4682, partial [Lecanoromycetidae sp. Uapishka_2]
MDTENTHEQSPLRTKQERVRAQKLRMSCDACSSSKTKCDQNRPICIRCQKVGLKCNYSVSQRKGKPPAASRDPSDSVNRRKPSQSKQLSKPALDKQVSGELDIHRATIEPTFHLDHDSTMMDLSLPMFDGTMPTLWHNFMPDMSDCTSSDLSMTPSNIFDQDYISMDAPSSHMKPTDDIFNFDNEFPDVLDLGPHHTPSSQAERQVLTNPLPTPTSSDIGSISQRYDCNKLASSTLESLNSHSQTCSASINQNTNSASFDQVLIVNKTAVENVHQLLSCPCSLSQQSNLLLSLIIDKILTLYQTIIRNDTCSRQLSPSSDSSSDQCVRDTPITIGAYKMDAKDEKRMRMHIVSNELRKAAALVERYADRYSNLGCQERDDMGIHTALISLLRRRLKEAVGDIVGALRNSRV